MGRWSWWTKTTNANALLPQIGENGCQRNNTVTKTERVLGMCRKGSSSSKTPLLSERHRKIENDKRFSYFFLRCRLPPLQIKRVSLFAQIQANFSVVWYNTTIFHVSRSYFCVHSSLETRLMIWILQWNGKPLSDTHHYASRFAVG